MLFSSTEVSAWLKSSHVSCPQFPPVSLNYGAERSTLLSGPLHEWMTRNIVQKAKNRLSFEFFHGTILGHLNNKDVSDTSVNLGYAAIERSLCTCEIMWK
ncbi:hypothetical protein AB6A40_003319 [Gnathostoma spinigerum]|uniref:Uncharacterized protein n=1 Tax=Gnathostoma spinigerum TaxID=75299 RepID=A0ABD6E974_9BILA